MMNKKYAFLLIALFGLMVTLMTVPSSAKRNKDSKDKDKAAEVKPLPKPQGLRRPEVKAQPRTPQVTRAVRTGESIALRDMPKNTTVTDAPSAKVSEGKVINRRNSGVQHILPAGTPRPSVDAAIRGKRVTNAPDGSSITPPPIGSFEALADTDNGVVGLGLVNPPDTNADVGYTQIVETVNSTFRVYDKTGAPLTPVLKQSALFTSLGGQCAFTDPGDPIVLHDRIADRWQISQFNFVGAGDFPPFHQCIAISKTSDAAGEYYLYDFVTPGNFPDYPKLGVWPDAYYMSSREFDPVTGFFLGVGAFAFNRHKMLAGDPTAELIFFAIPLDANYPSGTSSAIIPADHDGLLPPPPGAPNTFAIYDSDEFGVADAIHLFDFHADFVTPANSTFTERTESPISVPAFDDREPAGRADVEEPSPGENLDSIPDRLMFRMAYRNRGGVESLVTNHTVNVSGVNATSAASYQAASRYYELRKSTPGGAYTVYDAGTYAPDAGNGATGINRWMGSTAIDNQGNLAMGYSLSSTAVVPSLAYVGRAFDQLGGSLTNEQILFPGQGTQAAGSGNRWGDYSSLSVDPADDCTFWYANEYYPVGNTGFNWHTRVGNFKFPTCTAPAQGTLTGTITTCDSGAPIGEVLIEAIGGPSTGFSTATADDGTYTLHLAPGTYTVTASSGIRNCSPSASTIVTIVDGGSSTFSACLNGTANLILPEDDPTPATVVASGGNGNGQIDKNECNTLLVDLQDAGCAPARNVVATLTTTTPGVTITQPTSPYPNIPVDGVATNTIPFGVNTSSSFACGTPIDFTLTTTYTGGSDVLTFTLDTCQLPAAPYSGTIQAGDTQIPNGRLGRDGSPASCAGKACPGPLGAGGRSYDAHTFVNAGGVDACATIDLASACGATIFVGAYLNSFNPNDLCENYIGDAGASSTQQHFEVIVPAGQTLVVVVMEANAGTTCAYTGSVSGLVGNTDGGGECADLFVTKSDSPDPVIAGNNLTYTITVGDNGPAAAQGVTLTDNIPANTTFVSASQTSGPSFTLTPPAVGGGGTFTATIPTLANGASAVFQLVVKVNPSTANGSTITNTATVAGTSSDSNQTNNSDTEDTGVIQQTLTINDVVLTEGNSGTTNASFTVTLSPASLQPVTVDFATSDGTATDPSDFTDVSGTLTFTSGQTTKTINVPVVGDTVVEPDETFFVNLSNSSGATITDALGQGTIINDDSDVTVAVAPSSVSEDGVANLVYTFTRNGATTNPLTVNFSVGGTATFNTDYTQSGAATFSASSGTVVIGAGNTTATVTIDPTSDSTVESDETVILTLASGTGYNVGSPGAATGTITNDDTDVSVAVAPAAVAEDGIAPLVYTFTRNGVTTGALTVNFSVGGTATFSTDYTQTGAATFTATSGTVTFAPSSSVANVTVDPSTDVFAEPDETVILTVTAGSGYNVGAPSAATGTITNDDAAGGIIQFSSATYATTESSHFVVITVVRGGDTSGAATVNYASPDDSEAVSVTPCLTVTGFASPRCDFTTALGTLRFAAGETSKTFTVLISQDNFVEGPEHLSLTLSNPTGGAVLGIPPTAQLTIADDASEPATNPIDDASNFVRQQYHDFLNREPDAPGLAFWTNEITSCGTDAQCIAHKRTNVSAAFFLSIEFQGTGYFVERLYKTAYGDATGNSGAHTLPVPIIRFNEFIPDTQQIGQGLIVGQAGWEAVLEANKVAFVAEFVLRPRFTNAYPPSMTPATYVDTLNANAGGPLSTAERNQLVADLTAGTKTRAEVLRAVADDPTLIAAEFNRAFVLIQYFGYLRRNPNVGPDSDYSGYEFWLNKLNQFNGNFTDADMVRSFLVSGEYRGRFGN